MARSARILLLEDDDLLREGLYDTLTEFGSHQVHCAANGAAALELAAQHEFDLILSDIRMEGPDGLETVAKIKQNRPHISVIILTGAELEGDRGRAIDIAVDAYLYKGAKNANREIEVLLKTVESVLREPETKSFLIELLQPIWTAPLQAWREYQDKARLKELQCARKSFEALRDSAYKRLVTAIMSDLILQGPSLDIYDELTELDIAYVKTKEPSELKQLADRYKPIAKKLAEQEKNPTIAIKARPPNRLDRPSWKRVYDTIKARLLTATELQYIERLRWMKPEQRQKNFKWEALYQKVFSQAQPPPRPPAFGRS